jgi:hypothetical protein
MLWVFTKMNRLVHQLQICYQISLETTYNRCEPEIESVVLTVPYFSTLTATNATTGDNTYS